FGALYQHRMKIIGRRILAAQPGPAGLVLQLHDLVAGKDVWHKTFDPMAVVLHTDDANLTGGLEPNAMMVALDANTGATLARGSVLGGRVTAEEVKGLKEPLLLRDADRFYVALNKPVDVTKVQGGIIGNNFANGVRCAWVNGWVVALEAHDGQ